MRQAPTAPGTLPSSRAGLVLAVLATAQFLMTLDSSVMNVSLAVVADDLGTPITGIQTAITLYTLVMAALMITGGKLGTLLGRRRAFQLGLVVYGLGSLTTALAPNLAVLLLGWSVLEGIGAALIMPAVVALVAANVPAARRPAAYGLIAAAGAMAIAVGPLLGGAVTTFGSWRYVFAGELVVVVGVLAVSRRLEDVPRSPVSFDLVGAGLSVVGLVLVVLGVLRSSEWGWFASRPGGPELLGASPVVWLLLGGLLTLSVFLAWEEHLARTGREPLLPTDLLRHGQLVGGLSVFFGQFLVQSGVFFALPLFLSVALEMTALETGLRVLPLSVALLVTAAGTPAVFPHASPRRVVRLGLLAVLAGVLVLVAGMSPDADAAVVALPLLLLGAGLGALASQLGAVTVSAVPDARSADVGGLQNTVTNLGAALGTALVGSVLISALTTSVTGGLQAAPEVPRDAVERVSTRLAAGAPFLSDTQLREVLPDGGTTAAGAAVLEVNRQARADALRTAFGLTAVFTVGVLLLTGRLPDAPVRADRPLPPSAAGVPGTRGGSRRAPVDV